MTEVTIRIIIQGHEVAKFKATDPILPRPDDLYVYNSSDTMCNRLRVMRVEVCHGINTTNDADYEDERRVTYTAVDIHGYSLKPFPIKS